jgi:hypothetical protein
MREIEREWYSLARIAARLDCSEADVLHLAATGRLRLCYSLRGVPADEHFFDRQRRHLDHTEHVPNLHGLVGLTSYCAGQLEMSGRTTAQYFLNLSKPDHEWRLTKAAVRADRPEIAIRGEEVDVTILRDEVVVRDVDLEAYEAEAMPFRTRRNDAGHTEQSSEDMMAEMFDSVPVAALEKMFPANGKWKAWAERATSNGLSKAKTGRARFNPYHAAMWFLQQGMPDWDTDRAYRKLAANLPARSADQRDRLAPGRE